MHSIVHLQPIIPHYREEFFYLLSKKVHQDIYIYENIKDAKESSFNISKTRFAQIQSKMFRGGILVYNPFTLIKGYYDCLVLMLNFNHITTWLLLLTTCMLTSWSIYYFTERKTSDVKRWIKGKLLK